MNISAYLERIGYAGPATPTDETLIGLHLAHMMTVPFENLDIALGRKIICDEAHFLRKIVDQRRGGFCYELNGAFGTLLRELDFKVTLLSARVPHEDGTESPEFDHLALRVELDEPWLVDIGFGDSFVEPLRLKAGITQPQHEWVYRLVEKPDSLVVERSDLGGAWKKQYSFTLVPRRLDEFAPMCHYHQSSPESPFTRKSICSKATPWGRITVAERKLIVTCNGDKREAMLNSDEEWRSALKEHFGIVL